LTEQNQAEAAGVRPLSGIRVLAVEHYRMGPHGTMMLADAGAEVIRSRDGRELPFLAASLSRNKKSITLNLRHDEGRELFKSLSKVSDIVWENMRPGVMDRLGVGYATLKEVNPAIIFVSLSGFGQADILPGPYKDWPAFDPIGQAMSGLMFATGNEDQPPLYNTSVMADTVPSIVGAYGALVALQMRHRTGLGQHVDVAMYDNMVALNNLAISLYLLAGVKTPRGQLTSSAPFGPFKAKDGHVVLAVAGEKMWLRFCRAIGREDLVSRPGLSNGSERAENTESVLRPIVEGWMADKTRQQVCALLLEQGVPAAPAQDLEDVVVCPHLNARRMFWELDDPALGKVKVIGDPLKMSGAPPFPPNPAPQVGQHNEDVYSGLLGLDARQIAELKAKGAI
jgi:CoA:oxalate CoA-transferase